MDIFYIYFLHESLNNSSSGRNLTTTPHTWTLKPSQISSHCGKSHQRKETRFLIAKGKGSAHSLEL